MVTLTMNAHTVPNAEIDSSIAENILILYNEFECVNISQGTNSYPCSRIVWEVEPGLQTATIYIYIKGHMISEKNVIIQVLLYEGRKREMLTPILGLFAQNMNMLTYTAVRNLHNNAYDSLRHEHARQDEGQETQYPTSHY